MGQKVNPTGFRLGVIEGWQSRWYARRDYKDLLAEDRKLRAMVFKRLANAAVSKVEIERVAGNISVTVHTAKPGIVIGRNGEAVERLRVELERGTKKKVRLSIHEIRNAEVDSMLVAHSIAEQLERRVAFRRAMKQAVQKAMRGNAKGIKIVCAGRLGGAEIARVEKEVEGSVPLQTLRADIDYGFAEAHTTYGVIGVKVWIYHGDVLPEKVRQAGLNAAPTAQVNVEGERRGGERSGGGDRGPRSGGGDRGPRGGGGGDRGPRTGGGDRGPRTGGGDRGPRMGGGDRDRAPRAPRPATNPGASGIANANRPARPPRPRPDAPERAGATTTTERTPDAPTVSPQAPMAMNEAPRTEPRTEPTTPPTTQPTAEPTQE